MSNRVRVLVPCLKLLGAQGNYIYPNVDDIVDLHPATVKEELRGGKVVLAESFDKPTKKVKWQKPSAVAKLPEPEETESEEEKFEEIAPAPIEVKEEVEEEPREKTKKVTVSTKKSTTKKTGVIKKRTKRTDKVR